MPFSGPDDAKLPANIKKMSKTKRSAFASAFNSSMSSDDDESKAFAVGIAAAGRAGSKALGEGEGEGEGEGDGEGEGGDKHYDEAAQPSWSFGGGAQSFTDWDLYRDASEQEQHVMTQTRVFEGITQNIFSDSELSLQEKASKIASAANEMETRISEEPGEKAAKAIDSGGGFKVFDDAMTGESRWVAIYTNNFKDREGETFPEAAHRGFESWLDQTKEFPVLRLWHFPADLGVADTVAYEGGFMVASGTFNEGMKDVAESLRDVTGLKCSHGYRYDPAGLRDGVYHAYRSFEISVLPAAVAANQLTEFSADTEVVTVDAQKEEFLTEHLGPDRMDLLKRTVSSLAGKALGEGISFKDITLADLFEGEAAGSKGETVPEPTEGAPDTTPAATPGTTEGEGAAVAPAAVAPAAVAPAAVLPEPTPAAAAPAPATDAAAPGTVPATAEAAKAETADTPDPPDPLVAALQTVMAPMTIAIEALAAGQKVVAEGMKALQGTKDDAIAEAIRPRVGPTAAVGAAASAGDGNLLSEEQTKALAAGLEEGAKGTGQTGPVDSYVDMLNRQPSMNGS